MGVRERESSSSIALRSVVEKLKRRELTSSGGSWRDEELDLTCWV